MINLFRGQTADEAWRQAVAALSRDGVVRDSRAGRTLDLGRAAFEIADPRRRWVTSRRPALNPAFALAEVVWIMAGSDDAAFLNFWNRQLPQFAGGGATYHGAYGRRLRRHLGFDQLRRAASALRAAPESRQIALQIWDGRIDLPDENGRPAAPDIPCNDLCLLKIRDGRLEWTQILRSNDIFLGVPHNFVQFTCLQEILSGWIGVEPGSYAHWSDCLHVYERDLGALRQSLTAAPSDGAVSSGSLALPLDESEPLWSELHGRTRRLVADGLSETGLAAIADLNAPSIFSDWLLILSAEAARRRKFGDLAVELAGRCADPVLRRLWSNWLARLAAPQALEHSSGNR